MAISSSYSRSEESSNAGIDDQLAVGHDKRLPGDARNDTALIEANRAGENAAEDSFLTPDLSGSQPARRCQTSQVGAGARAAGRAVICLAGTEHKVAGV